LTILDRLPGGPLCLVGYAIISGSAALSASPAQRPGEQPLTAP
jgi:hypothetical protein